MKTLLDVVALSAQYLKAKGIANPRRQAEELIADAFHLSRLQLYTDFDRPLNEEELELCRQRLSRRALGEPLAYIHGEVEFYQCRFKVNPSVLIPRQETEILTDKIVCEMRQDNLEGKILWDVCCGSGCIGIAIGKKFPQLQVVLSDLSFEAIAVAKENAAINGVSALFSQGDLLSPFEGKKADYIICNPPYVSEQEYQTLEREVRDHEPHCALVSGSTGLEFYMRLAHSLPDFLSPCGKAWMEMGAGQGNAILSLFNQPCWKQKRVESDWAGHDRFFFLENE